MSFPVADWLVGLPALCRKGQKTRYCPKVRHFLLRTPTRILGWVCKQGVWTRSSAIFVKIFYRKNPAGLLKKFEYEKFFRNFFARKSFPSALDEPVFNPIVLKEGYPFFGCCRNLSTAMMRQNKGNCNFLWLCTTMDRPDRSYEEDKIIRKNPIWKQKIINNFRVPKTLQKLKL